MFIQSYCVKFGCDYDEARDKTDNFHSQTLWELMCFKQLQLCYGTSVHETILIHLIDKSDFILLITKHVPNLCSNLRTVIFPALSLPSRKFQPVINANPTKRLAPYFAICCTTCPKQDIWNL